jgi:3-oxoacyl-[acyl-carrier-protein] synthase II
MAVLPTQKEKIACINVHGTATLYNDEMEAIALSRAGLQTIPMNGYKGYYGHTMGGAGVIETLLTLHALDAGLILGTRGFNQLGVSAPVAVSQSHRSTDKKTFIKLMSGFGGCNGALCWTKESSIAQEERVDKPTYSTTHRVHITPSCVEVDGKELIVLSDDENCLTAIYKEYVKDYPRYYKMDGLSRLGFLATELLLQAAHEECNTAFLHNASVVFVSRSGSLADDKKHQSTIASAESYFPSPAVFVYTLPNIVTGEVAIRHRIYGETTAYILEEKNAEQIEQLLSLSFFDPTTSCVIGGWLEYTDGANFEADLVVLKRMA